MASGKSDLFEVHVEIKRETGRAILVDAGLEDEIWLPKSQIEIDDEKGTVSIPEWLAKEKGLL